MKITICAHSMHICIHVCSTFLKKAQWTNKMIHLTLCKNTKANLYYTFCFILTVVYFASIVYNLSIAEEMEFAKDDQEVANEDVKKLHSKDISMAEYVEIKLRALSGKPWNVLLKSPLVRNYILLLSLILLFFAGFFTYAVYKQYQRSEIH